MSQKFLMQPGIPTETAVRVYKRYLRLEPSHTEEYVAYLKSKARTSPWVPLQCAAGYQHSVRVKLEHHCIIAAPAELVGSQPSPTCMESEARECVQTHCVSCMSEVLPRVLEKACLHVQGLWEEAARKMAELVNDDGFRSLEGKSKHQVTLSQSCVGVGAAFLHAAALLCPASLAGVLSPKGRAGLQLWLELCDLITRHPREVAALKVDAILRSGIRKFTDEARAPCMPGSHT